jgi:hypothetical protein
MPLGRGRDVRGPVVYTGIAIFVPFAAGAPGLPRRLVNLLSQSPERHRNTFFISSDLIAVQMPPLALNSEVLSLTRTKAHHSL